jgi:hypothetical protein
MARLNDFERLGTPERSIPAGSVHASAGSIAPSLSWLAWELDPRAVIPYNGVSIPSSAGGRHGTNAERGVSRGHRPLGSGLPGYGWHGGGLMSEKMKVWGFIAAIRTAGFVAGFVRDFWPNAYYRFNYYAVEVGLWLLLGYWVAVGVSGACGRR